MDPFTAIPVEACQAILEEITSLHNLQSAILSSRPLMLAYSACRRLIRQRIFFNQYQILTADLDGSEDEIWNHPSRFTIATIDCWIQQLSEKDPYDGLILREIIWPHLLVDQQQKLKGTPTYACEQNQFEDLFCLWAQYLATAYRQFQHESLAMKVESQTLDLLFSKSVYTSKYTSKSYLLWFEATVSACMHQGKQVYAAGMCEKLWSRIDGDENHSHNLDVLDKLALVKITSMLCHYDGPTAVRPIVEVNSALVLAWEYLILQSVGQPGMFCYLCFDAAKSLVKAIKNSQGTGIVEPCQLYLEKIWQSSPPRSLAFDNWSRLLVDSYADRLEGTWMVWKKLQEMPLFSNTDLDWSRDIILQLRKRGLTDQSLSFQADFFEHLPPTCHQFCAFGRNLADAYVKNNQIYEAIRVREQVLVTFPESSRVRTSWVMALTSLYRKVGKEYCADTRTDSNLLMNE